MDEVEKVVGDIPMPEGGPLAYGTAGFRTEASKLDAAIARMGFVAVCRAIQKDQAVGMMITASHNGWKDNGLKLVDTDGGMLDASWEPQCTALANTAPGGVVEALHTLCGELGVDESQIGSKHPIVFVGRDTRESSVRLAGRARAGVEALGGICVELPLPVGTPAVHWIVRAWNRGELGEDYSDGSRLVKEYISSLAGAFVEAVTGAKRGESCEWQGEGLGRVVVDLAFGAGSLVTRMFEKELEAAWSSRVGGEGGLEILCRNVWTEGVAKELLNEGCGAEFVQKQRLPPSGMEEDLEGGERCASFDGDADRIVYHWKRDGEWRLLDGDRLAVLLGNLVAGQLREAGLEIGSEEGQVSMGVVQTAYANGAATRAIESHLRVPVATAKTGVKFVHHAALEFDVGVYFEANGHGTVLFSEPLQARLATLLREAEESAADVSPSSRTALRRLDALIRLINQGVGDALADLLAAEVALALTPGGIRAWDALYEDLPSRQGKLPVADRTVIHPEHDERRITAPERLQNVIDDLVESIDPEFGRAFVRPSGTEDVVRIYAEASTQEKADQLASETAKAVHTIAGGTGPSPPSWP